MAHNLRHTAPSPENERVYFDYVDWMILTNRDEWMSNAKPEHAVYIMQKFFENATERVRVFTGKLKQQQDDVAVWSDQGVIQAAHEFLSKARTQLLIVADERKIDAEYPNLHPFLHTLRKFAGQSNKMQIRSANKVSIDFLDKHDLRKHFMLMDNRGIRLETNQEKTKAHVNFNNKRTVEEQYSWIFDDVLFSVGHPLFPANIF